MTEFFIHANSFAAPFFSDESSGYVVADTASAALDSFARSYSHPAGLYAAIAYASADAMHKGERPLARWLCNHERTKAERTAGLSCYRYLGHEPGRFEINGEMVEVPDPKSGSVVPA